jgi:UTP--glucose-1-phosphate uridylyltransferase
MQVTKAIFPVAGLGTRFLPATKANPKEMLPVVDKPLIQYAVEEAVRAGIKELIFVTSSSKRAIEDHFDTNFELEAHLRERGKLDLLENVQNILPDGVSCAYIRQKSPQGLGHAVLCAKHLIGNQAFAVLLADDLIDGGAQSCLEQMMNVFNQNQASVVAVQEIKKSESRKYGIVDLVNRIGHLAELKGVVEKPEPEDAPSNFGIVGRYILTPKIFSFLETTTVGSGGEIQLTDAIAKLILADKAYALQFSGKRYDCGTKLGYLEATIAFALKHPELSTDFRHSLREMLNELA